MKPQARGTAAMRWLLLALLPGVIAQTVVFGIGTLLNLILCAAGCIVIEAACLNVRARTSLPELRSRLSDGSALLSGLLLGLALPAQGPWWLPLLGAALAMVIGKHLLASRGASPFNPAMVGLALLLLCVPQAMTGWLPAIDGMSSATLLDHVRTELHLERTLGEIRGGTGLHQHGEAWINLAFLAGGLWLLKRRQLSWQIPLGVIAAVAVPALLFWAGDTSRHPSPLFHLFSGGTMLAAFFIATAPPSSPRTAKARLAYGLGIGATVYAIRSWGAHPDGVAFAVLLLNAAAPALDRGGMFRRPNWPLLATAVALAAVAMLSAFVMERHRANALPDLAELGMERGAVTDAEAVDDPQLGKFTLYRLEQDGTASGMIVRTRADGYAGDVDVVTAIDGDGRILSVRVLHHDETRGIGDRIEAAHDSWILRFSGRSLGDATIDQLSGATVSAHAVRTAAQRSLEYFAAHRDNPPSP